MIYDETKSQSDADRVRTQIARVREAALAKATAERDNLRELAEEAILQVEYLHEKFQPTGTGEAFIVRARAILAALSSTEATT